MTETAICDAFRDAILRAVEGEEFYEAVIENVRRGLRGVPERQCWHVEVREDADASPFAATFLFVDSPPTGYQSPGPLFRVPACIGTWGGETPIQNEGDLEDWQSWADFALPVMVVMESFDLWEEAFRDGAEYSRHEAAKLAGTIHDAEEVNPNGL